MANTSRATAVWETAPAPGKGRFEAGSGAFRGEFSAATRFEGARGTNPEELIAAAHASCMSMALSFALGRAGTPAERIATTAACTIDRAGEGFRITTMRLEVRGKVPGIDQAAFAKAAEAAKETCPVSQALKGNVTLEFDAKLE